MCLGGGGAGSRALKSWPRRATARPSIRNRAKPCAPFDLALGSGLRAL